MRFEQLMLEPEVAKMLLDGQATNRTVSPPHVNKIKEDIRAGRYMLNPNPICVTADGTMIDGQHRCLACVETNTPIPVIICWDVPDETRRVLDGGRARSANDILRINHSHIPSVTSKSAAATLILKNQKFPSRIWNSTNTPVSRQEIEDEVVGNQDDYQVAWSFANSIMRVLGVGRLPRTSNLLALHLLVTRHSTNAHLLDSFADGMRDPVAVCEGNTSDPRYVYREQQQGAGFGQGQSGLLAAIVAWNAYVDGKAMKLIHARRNMLPMPPVR